MADPGATLLFVYHLPDVLVHKGSLGTEDDGEHVQYQGRPPRRLSSVRYLESRASTDEVSLSKAPETPTCSPGRWGVLCVSRVCVCGPLCVSRVRGPLCVWTSVCMCSLATRMGQKQRRISPKKE